MDERTKRDDERRPFAAVSLWLITACVCAFGFSPTAADPPGAKGRVLVVTDGDAQVRVAIDDVVVVGEPAAEEPEKAPKKQKDPQKNKPGVRADGVKKEAQARAVVLKEAGAARMQAVMIVGGNVAAVPKATKASEKKAEKGKESDIPGTTRAVFFNEDRDLGARLRKAAQLRNAGKLQQAFDLYLWVLESGDDALFRLDEHRLTGLRDYCMRKLAELPKDFLTQYRLRTDGEVARLFAAAKATVDAGELESLGDRYYLSTYGPEVLDYAGDVYAGRAEYDRAAACWRRMLKWGTGPLARELIETKLALVLGRRGKVREAQMVVATLRERDADARVTLGGTKRAAVEYLDTVLPKSAQPSIRTVAVNRGHWPQLGGDGGHGETMPVGFKCDVKVGDFVIPGYDYKAPPVDPRLRTVYNAQQAQLLQGYAPFVPIYAGGRVFIHDESGMTAFRLNAISEDWTVGTMGRKSTGPRRSPFYYSPGAVARGWVCAYADGVVYATFRKSSGGAEVWAVSERGKVLWRISRSLVGYEWMSGVSAISDPVVYDGSVFFLTWQGYQYRHDCHVVSVDVATGKLNWKEFICAGAQMPTYYYGRYGGARLNVNVPAAVDGVLVACSDLGGIAALDARSGEFRWGFAYEQYAPGYRHFVVNRGTTPAAVPPSGSSTPVVHESVAYVTPKDSSGIYAIDLNTGRCLWRKSRGRNNSILGAAGERIVVAGTRVTAYEAFSGEVAWQHDEDVVSSGQGFLTRDAVYVPTRKAIYRFHPQTGKVLGRLLVDASAGEVGNLLLVEDTMVQLGRRANFYGVWERVYTKLAGEIARNPKDHEPHIRLGAIYARKEDRPSAIRSYETALELTLGLEEKRIEKQRAAIKTRLYDLYRAQIGRTLADGRLDRALTLGRRIRSYATTDERRIAVVVMMIDIYTKRGDWKSVVREYQSFLEHPPKIVYSFDGSSSMLPTLYARLRIRELIAKHGRAVYAEYDAKAAKLTRDGSREGLEKVTRVYPNSTSSLRALRRLSDVEASTGNYRKAARYLTEYVRSTDADAADLVPVQWKLAHYHERNRSYSAAKRILRDLAERYPEARVGTDKRTLKAVVAERLAKPEYRRRVGREPSRFVAPLVRHTKLPVGGTPQDVRGIETILVLDRKMRLHSIAGATGKLLWSTNIGSTYLAGSELHGDRLMVCGRRSVKLLDVKTGRMQWSYSVANPIGKALNRRVRVPTVIGGAFDDEHVALNLGGGVNEVVLLSAAEGGKTLWRKKLRASPVWGPVIWQDRVIVTTINSVNAYDVGTGEQVIHLKGQRPRRRSVLLDDGRLLIGGTTHLSCVDLTNGRTLWSRRYLLYYANRMSTDGIMPVGKRTCFVSYTTDRKVFCVDVADGQQVWSTVVGTKRDRPIAVRVVGDEVYVLLMRSAGRERDVRVLRLGLEDGKPQWTSVALKPPKAKTGEVFMATGRDWRVGRDHVAVLVELWQMKKVGRGMRTTVTDPRVFCLDKKTGEVVQALPVPAVTKPAANRPTNIVDADDMLWVTYYDRMVGLKGPR